MIEIKAKEIVLVPIEKIIPNPMNPNVHGEAQIDILVKIYNARGFGNPLTISNLSGFLNEGEGRLLAAKKAGMTELPCIYQDFESAAEEFAHMVASNKAASLADHDDLKMIEGIKDLELEEMDFELLGLEDFELPLESTLPEEEPEMPGVPKETVVKRGDIWLLGNHRVMCGDSTMIDDVEKLMKGEKADMVFTDPPYGIGFKYNSHRDSTGDEYMDFCRDWFHWLKTKSDFIVISTGWAYDLFWNQQSPKDKFYWLCRNKRTGGSASHFRKVEPLFIWGKPENRYDFDFFEQTHQIEAELKGEHTCPKPVGLIEAIIAGCKKQGSVLDVFGGSGTTLIACEKTSRVSSLMEIDPHYCDVIINRWQNYTGKKAVLESTGEEYKALN